MKPSFLITFLPQPIHINGSLWGVSQWAGGMFSHTHCVSWGSFTVIPWAKQYPSNTLLIILTPAESQNIGSWDIFNLLLYKCIDSQTQRQDLNFSSQWALQDTSAQWLSLVQGFWGSNSQGISQSHSPCWQLLCSRPFWVYPTKGLYVENDAGATWEESITLFPDILGK